MTVRDLKKILEDKPDDSIVTIRDAANGWSNLENACDTYPGRVVLIEDKREDTEE